MPALAMPRAVTAPRTVRVEAFRHRISARHALDVEFLADYRLALAHVAERAEAGRLVSADSLKSYLDRSEPRAVALLNELEARGEVVRLPQYLHPVYEPVLHSRTDA